MGISGAVEGVPQLPDGKLLPPMAMTCGEIMLRKAVKEKFGHTVTIGRSANLTAPLNGRAPCHYCGPCERGCITHSYFNSPTVTLAAAQATGRLTLLTDAVVSHVTTDLNRGRATAVRYVHRLTRESRELRGKVVVLCAQSMESVRILFNSTNRQFPNGLANSSGVLGHYLMDHFTGYGASGVMPMLESRPWAGPPRRPNGIYVIRFRNVTDPIPASSVATVSRVAATQSSSSMPKVSAKNSRRPSRPASGRSASAASASAWRAGRTIASWIEM